MRLIGLAPGRDLLPGALFVQLLRGLDGLEPPPEGLGRELCYLGAVEEDDGRVVAHMRMTIMEPAAP
jgi:hypothetical protein